MRESTYNAVYMGVMEIHETALAIIDLYHSLQQHQILNPLSKVKDQTHILNDTIRFLTHQATVATPDFSFLKIMVEML